jgi:serine protease AprX
MSGQGSEKEKAAGSSERAGSIFYSVYSGQGTSVLAEVRRETYGEDIGQFSWVTAGELRKFFRRLELKADSRVLRQDGYKARRSDWWTYDAPRATAQGTDAHTYTTSVSKATRFLKVTLAHPSGSAVGVNLMEYDVTVKDAAGNVVGTSTDDLTESTGTASAFIDLSKVTGGVHYGTFTIEVSGQEAASDPDTLDSDSDLGRMITLEVVQLVAG